MSAPTEEIPDSDNRGVHRSGSRVWLFGIVLLIYVCIPVPLAALLMKLGWHEQFARPLEIVYAPLEWLYEHVSFVHAFYEWQHKLFGL